MDALTEPDTADNADDDEPRRGPRPGFRARLATRLADVSPAAWVVAFLIAAYIVVFGTLTWHQETNFGTFGFDMGVYDQVVWLLSRFHTPFITIRGLNLFGFHVNLILFLFVPFYWLGAGAHFLYLVETVWMALGAVPVYLLGRDKLSSPWLATTIAGAFLLYPSLEWINWWHFHPDALITMPLLFAYWLATRRRWRWFGVAVGVALLCKEDAALAVFVLGVIVAWRYSRKAGIVTALVGAGWFVLCTKLILPHGNGVGPFYEDLFPGFGNSIGEIAWNMVVHPSRLYHLATLPNRRTYYWKLLAPVAFLPLTAIPVLIAGPQTVVNVISGHGYTADIKYHYSSILIAAVFIATVESCARPSRAGVQRFLVGMVAATSLTANALWSPSPIGQSYRTGIWAQPQARHEVMREAIRKIPPNAGLSAMYYLVTHTDHRVHIFEWPNPWIEANWSVRGENPPKPKDVTWFIVDRTLLDPNESKPLFDKLTGPGGGYRIVFDKDDIVVATRS